MHSGLTAPQTAGAERLRRSAPTASADRPRRGRGRRPFKQVRAEIVEAVGELLLSEGMAAFTIERVAAVAGASKTTIYKWWPSRGALALEGYAARIGSTFPFPDSGDIEADMTTHLTTFVTVLRDTPAGRVTSELLGAAQTDPRLAEAFRRVYLEPRRAIGIAVLRKAQERNQLDSNADVEVLSDQLWGACMYRLMTGHQPLDEQFARALVRNVIRGVRIKPL